MPDPEVTTYERSDVSSRSIVKFGWALAILLVVTFFGMRFFLRVLDRDVLGPGARVAAPQLEVPAPRLQTDEKVDLARLRAAEDERLNHYGWVDRDAGVIHMPIERAMKLTVQRGLPARASREGGKP